MHPPLPRPPRYVVLLAAPLLAAAAQSCAALIGLDEYIDCPEDPKCPPPDAGTTTGTGGQAPAPTCTDEKKNGGESDVDCGGSECPKCPDGKGCDNGGDCASKVCQGGLCIAPACTDSVQNGDETDSDCGGPTCPACAAGAMCVVDGDCAGGLCDAGTCAPTCTDGATNGDETDTDCGGPACPRCALDKACLEGPDCETGVCQAKKCVSYYVWAKSFGDSELQRAGGMSVDSIGNAYLLGNITGSVNFGGSTLTAPTQQAIAAAKFDENGQHQWSKIFTSGQGNNVAAAAAYASSGVAFTGNAQPNTDFGGGPLPGGFGSYNMFVAKLDAAGDHVWSTMFPGSMGKGIAVSSLGHTTVIGETSGGTDFGCGGLPPTAGGLVVVTFSAQNACSWAKRVLASASDTYYATAIAAGLPFENVIAGTFVGTINLDCGSHASQGSSAGDIFLAKLGVSGTCMWSKAFGGTAATPLGYGQISGLATDGAGDVFVAGDFTGTLDFGTGATTSQGTRDVFVAKLDGASGSTVWFKSYGSPGSYSGIAGLAVSTAGNIALTGGAAPGIDLGGGPLTHAFAAEFDGLGNYVWSRGFGTSDPLSGGGGTHVASVGNSSVVLAGAFSGHIDFGGPAPLAAMGNTDIFLAKLRLP